MKNNYNTHTQMAKKNLTSLPSLTYLSAKHRLFVLHFLYVCVSIL